MAMAMPAGASIPENYIIYLSIQGRAFVCRYSAGVLRANPTAVSLLDQTGLINK